MKKLNSAVVVLFGLILFIPSAAVDAQDEKPSPTEQNLQAKAKPNLMAELGLTPEQIREIRRINQENRVLLRPAQQRHREANRRVDEAIYADAINEADLTARIKEVQDSQMELTKLRFAGEFAVRRILSAPQLAKFRELRRQFLIDNQVRPNQRPQNFRKFSNQRFNNRSNQSPAPNN